jgi:hypothetical protein
MPAIPIKDFPDDSTKGPAMREMTEDYIFVPTPRELIARGQPLFRMFWLRLFPKEGHK